MYFGITITGCVSIILLCDNTSFIDIHLLQVTPA